MESGAPLIYSGRIEEGLLLGDPDLLRKEADGYVAGDIKSGAGVEGSEDLSTPKKHYAVQLALYTDILERKGLSAGRHGFIWDVNGEEVPYDFAQPYGKRNPRTLWEDYQECLETAQAIIANPSSTIPAYSSGLCKLCHWYSACLGQLKATDDLTLIPELGRSKRDSLADKVSTVHVLAETDPNAFVKGKKTIFPGIGPETLIKLHERARLLTSEDAKPTLISPIQFPDHEVELFFDIEVDPMRDYCYLHGFVERTGRDNSTERFIPFFVNSPAPECEKEEFANAMRYIAGKRPCSIYFYSKYERTIYRKLQGKYPDVCTAEEIEDLFNPKHAIDLYFDVVKKFTEWPTRDYSIKTLATYLGFQWRDTHPSGAASIEWFDQWVRTEDARVRQRILDYNEDDCIATRVLLDGIRALR